MKNFGKKAWIIIICAAAITTLSLGIRQSFGLFLKPISQDLEVGRQVFSFAMGIATLLQGLATPFFGALADRFGTMRTLLFGATLYGISLALASFSAGPTSLQLTYGVLFGIALSATAFPVMFGAIARAVKPEKRTLAFGVVTAGGSIGQFLCIPFAQVLLTQYGWREATLLLALMSAVMLPLAFFGLREPQSGLAAPGTGQSLREALVEARGHSGYWLLCASFFVCGFHISFVTTHLPSFFADKGLPGGIAAQAFALIGLFNIFGSQLFGWLGGRYRKRYLLTFIYAARSAIFLPLLFIPITPAVALTFSAALGFLWLGTVPPTSGLVAQIFGARFMATLFSIVFATHQIGGFIGAWLGGVIFDRYKSYDLMWWIAIGLGFAAAIAALPIKDKTIVREVPPAPPMPEAKPA
jgi:predicted MFS family arabinose efflux permease